MKRLIAAFLLVFCSLGFMAGRADASPTITIEFECGHAGVAVVNSTYSSHLTTYITSAGRIETIPALSTAFNYSINRLGYSWSWPSIVTPSYFTMTTYVTSNTGAVKYGPQKTVYCNNGGSSGSWFLPRAMALLAGIGSFGGGGGSSGSW